MKETLHKSVWRHRDVRLILPGRTIALAGNAMVLVTLLLKLHADSRGPLAIAGLMACIALPAILTIGISGHLADTRDSRLLLGVGIGVQMAACLGLALADSLPLIYGLVLVMELGAAVIAPVWSGLLPRVVGEDNIGQVISWQQGLAAVGGPVGAALAGVLVGRYDARLALLVAAGTFTVLLVVSQVVRTRRHLLRERTEGLADQVEGLAEQAIEESRAGRHRMFAGLDVVRRDAIVFPLFMLLMPMVILVEGVNTVEVFLAMDALQATPEQYGLGEFFAGAGAIVGSLIVARLRGTRPWVSGTLLGFGLACALIAVAGVAPNFWIYLVIVSLLSTAASIGNASQGALIMTRTADADRGKVQAGLSGVARACSLLALALGGTIGTLVGPRPVFIGAGLLGLLVIVGFSVGVRRAVAAEVAETAAQPRQASPSEKLA